MFLTLINVLYKRQVVSLLHYLTYPTDTNFNKALDFA